MRREKIRLDIIHLFLLHALFEELLETERIRGRFDGVLNVRRRLLIRASGRVTGTVRYGQIEIECGGQISGDVQSQPTASELPASLVETRPLIETPRETDLVE